MTGQDLRKEKQTVCKGLIGENHTRRKKRNAEKANILQKAEGRRGNIFQMHRNKTMCRELNTNNFQIVDCKKANIFTE